jgi:CRISPR-associated endonuclease/helicase Cas3
MSETKLSSSFQLRSHPDRLLRAHLLGVAKKSKILLDDHLNVAGHSFPLDHETLHKIVHLVGVAHDLGKATRYFQDYLPPRSRPTDPLKKSHAILSSTYGRFAARKLFSNSEYCDLIAQNVSLAILAHHGRLQKPTVAVAKTLEWRQTIDDQVSAIDRKDELNSILEEAKIPSFTDFAANQTLEVRNYPKTQLAAKRQQAKFFGKSLSPYLLLNLLFSMLVDADRMDAAGLTFPERHELDSNNVKNYVSLLSSSLRNKTDPAVAGGRDKLFKKMAKMATTIPLTRRLLSLTAPTGYGKTMAGIYFALKLRERIAAKRGINPRIIYVAPFLSILDQNYERIADALGIPRSQSGTLLLHHHLAEIKYQDSADLSTETYSTLDSELLIEGWNAEVIVTTFIQFFYTLIGTTASQLRKLSKLTGSIVILDEVQAIPHEYWALIREILSLVANKLQMYVILMTATQPLIFRTDKVLELASLRRESSKPRVTLRNNIGHPLSLDNFIEEINRLLQASSDKSTLIVMNTVDTAIEVFNRIESPLDKYCLTAKIVPAHRKQRLKEIAMKLEQRVPTVVVSTQVVEAGVDLDFDVVVRDIAPIDSILQVAGRCNRNGTRNARKSLVHIYSVMDNRTGCFYANRIYGNFLIEKSREVLHHVRGADMSRLAREYYSAVSKGASDVKSDRLLKGIRELDYETLKDFRLIDDQPTVSVYVEADEQASRTWNKYTEIQTSNETGLRRKEEFLKIRADFYSYVINVSARECAGLQESKGVFYIPHSEIRTFYDENTGFVRVTQSGSERQAEARIY